MIKKFGQTVDFLYKNIIITFFWPMILSLTAFAAISTATTNLENSEITYFLKDSAGLNLLAFIAVAAIFCIFSNVKIFADFSQKLEADTTLFKKLQKALLLIILAAAVIWVTGTQFIPNWDQKNILDAALSLHLGNYDLFAPGKYIARNPHQIGLVWFYYLLTPLLGTNNYLALQIINAVFLVIFYYSLSELAGCFNFGRTNQLLVLLAGLVFFPPILYCSYVYGNIMGLSLSTLAILHQFRFFESKKTAYAISSAAFIALGICFKSNYLIFMIGMIIYTLKKIIAESKPLFSLLLIFMVVFYSLQATLPVVAARNITGQPMDQNMSNWSYIAMGLQECEKAPGWYNGYNWDSFGANNFDTDAHTKAAKEDIEKSIEKFKNDKDYSAKFFTKKALSQWNNPTYQSMWTVRILESDIYISDTAHHLLSGKGSSDALQFLNIVQFLIFSGAVLYCMLFYKEEKYSDSLILPMIFIGGFIFHMIWEAKSQYVFSFVVLLLPYAVAAYSKLAQLLNTVAKKEISLKPILILKTPFLYLAVITAAVLMAIHSGNGIDYLTSDDESFGSYIQLKDDIAITESGSYSLTTEGGFTIGLTTKDGFYVPVVGLTEETEKSDIQLHVYQNNAWLLFAENNMLMTYTETGSNTNRAVIAFDNKLTDEQKWIIERADDNQVFIRYNKTYYLTYDEETMEVYTAPYSGMANQIWNVNKL